MTSIVDVMIWPPHSLLIGLGITRYAHHRLRFGGQPRETHLREHALNTGFELSIATTPPSSRQRLAALAAVLAIIIIFGIVASFGAVQLPQVDSFVPLIDGTIFLTDLVTAVLLLGQFSTTGLRALLVLASGYLFTALIAIPHALTFPGAFTRTGLLGAGPQAAPWLFTFAHFGLPIAVIAYVGLKDREPTGTEIPGTITPLLWSLMIIVGLISVITLVTIGEGYLPPLLQDEVNLTSALPKFIAGTVLLLSAAALLLLWIRRKSILDLWLMVMLGSHIAEVAVILFAIRSRFSLAFYGGRLFSIVVSTVMLVVLLSETTKLYAMLASAMRALRRERDNKLMNMQALTAAIAHEVRQPLGAIQANSNAALNFLRRSPPDLEEIRAALTDVLGANRRVSEVFDSIRALFGGVDQARQPIDVNEIILKVLHAMHGELKDHDVTASPELAAELPLVEGHDGQLQEVIVNLVQNAVEAMAMTANRNRVLRVTTELRGHDAIAVAVQNSGPGVDPQQLDSIFTAFVTTKKHGIGLGLAICHMIVERHGGQLTASSDGKSGTLLQFVLPIRRMRVAPA